MAETKIDMLEEIKKLNKESKLVIGSEKTLKDLKNGKISKVFLASNASKETKSEVARMAEITGIDTATLKVNNDELGVLCRKPFSISVLGRTK